MFSLSYTNNILYICIFYLQAMWGSPKLLFMSSI